MIQKNWFGEPVNQEEPVEGQTDQRGQLRV
jgi:hypothetical protein